MTTKMWSKKETQSVIGQLRAAGYTVAKVDEIYKILDDGGEVWRRGGRDLFTAMIGTRGYLVSYHDDLLSPA